MTLRTCKKCIKLFDDKKNDNAWDFVGMLTMGWSSVVEPDDRKYCRDCVKD